MATLSLSSRLVTNPAGQPRPGQGCRCIVHAVVGGEGGDQRLPARPDWRPCRSLRESTVSGGPPTPSSSVRYCGQDAASRRRLCHMPMTLRYIFLRNLPCSTARALPPSCGSFSTSVRCYKATYTSTIIRSKASSYSELKALVQTRKEVGKL